MGSNIELNVDDFSDERFYKTREERSSLVSQNSGLKKRKNLDDSEGTLANPSQNISSSFPTSQLSKGEILKFEKARPMTNDQILDFIEKEVALLKSVSRKKDDMEWQRFNPVCNEQCTTAPGEEDNSILLLPFEPSPKSKEKCGISASEKDLTDDQHVMLEVSATSCTTKEAESPVIITVGSGVTLPKKTEKYPGLISSCSSSQGECKRDKEAPLSLLSKHVRQEREDISPKPVEGVGLDSVQDTIDGNHDANAQTNIEDQQYCHVESKEAAELFCLNSLTEKIETMQSVTVNPNDQSVCSQTSSKNMEEDASAVCLQADLSISLAVNKDSKIMPSCRPEGEDAFFVAVLNGPRCEGISDAEDLPRLNMNLLNTKQEEERFANSVYEDISEYENPQFQNMAEEVPEANAMQYEPVHRQVKMNPSLNEELIPKEQLSPKTETGDSPQHCSCPCLVESEDGFEYVLCSKCDSEKHLKGQSNSSFGPLSVTQHQEEAEEAAEEDSEWLVIPINVKDVKWEAADKTQVDGENILQCDSEHENQVKQSDTHAAVCEVPISVPNQVPAAAFPPMEVFDTPSQQAKAIQSRETAPQSFLVPSSWGTAETKAHRPQNREPHCDPEDSCETEDSSDYSSDSERNYLTVSTQFLKSLSVPASPETDDSDSEKENEDHEMPNLQHCQTRGRSKSSGKDDIINLDSDTEDEGFQNCAETKTKRLFSTHTQNSGTACLNQVKKLSPETVDDQCGTVKENLQTNRLQSTDSQASQCPSRCNEEVIQTRNAPLSQRADKCEHLLENKIVSHHVKKESYAQNISDDPSVIVIFDSDDEGKQSNRQVKRKGMLASELMSGGSTSCGEQRRDSEKKESAKPKDREPSVPFADSSKSQHQSKLQHMQLKEKRLDVHCSLSHGIKKRKLIKVRVHPEHGHQKPNRQITSKSVERGIAKNLMKNKTNVVLSEKDDSVDTLVNAQSSLCVSKKPQISLSSKDSSKILSQSVDRDVDSTKAHHEHFQRKAKRQMASKTVEREIEKGLNKQKRKTLVLSSETEDSDDTLIYVKTSLSSADMPEKHPQTVDSDDDSTVAPNPVIPRFLIQKFSQSSKHLKLVEQSTVQKRGKNGSRATPKTPTETSKKTDSSKKEAEHFFKGIKGKVVCNSKPMSDAHHTAPLPRSMDSSCSSREHVSSSKLQRSDSYSNSSTSCPPTMGPSSSTSMQSSAKKQVFHDWQNSFVPTRRDRKASLKSNLRRRNNCNFLRGARPGPSHHNKAPRWRRSSYDSESHLMKRLKYEAIQMTGQKTGHSMIPCERRLQVEDSSGLHG